MAVSTARRPLPAIVFLLVLTVVTGVVWWRVLHRSDSSADNPAPTGTKAVTCASAGVKPLTLPSPKSVTVVVYNGADRNQLATTVSNELKARGFKTGTPQDAPTPYSGTAEIQYGKPSKSAATLLAYYLPGARLVASSRTDATVYVTLGAAYKSLASQASVNAAVARAKKPC